MLKVGDKVKFKDNGRKGKIMNILKNYRPHCYVVNFSEKGKNNREFCTKKELIKID